MSDMTQQITQQIDTLDAELDRLDADGKVRQAQPLHRRLRQITKDLSAAEQAGVDVADLRLRTHHLADRILADVFGVRTPK